MLVISAKYQVSSYTTRNISVKHTRFVPVYCFCILLVALMCLLVNPCSGQASRPMALQSAPALAIGKTMLPVTALDAAGKPVEVHDGKAKWTIVAFLSTRCPCTARYLTRLEALMGQFGKHGVRLVGINSNANELPEDAAIFAREQKLRFPFLKDTEGSVARALRPQVTPEVFVLDAQRRVRYHGAIDDSLYGDNIKRFYLRDALASLTTGKPVRVPRQEATGCAIFLHKLAGP